MVHPEDLEAVKEANRAALAGDKSYDIEHRIVRPDGSVRWVHEQADIVRDAEDKAVSMVGVVQDITERKTAEERIQYLAYYDALTGLPNRALFMDRLQHAVIDADRRERLVGVMFLDVDRFKDVNDSLGHETGDQLLKAVAERLTAVVRKGDTVARLGGDEFTIILAGMAHVDDAARVAQKILEVFEQPFHVAQREFHMTASVGITLYPFDDSNSSHLLRNADIAMYRAKEAGRNTYQFYTAEMTAKASERLTLKNDLQRALKQHEFSLVYQPIVDSGGNILGVEALLRWQHPNMGSSSRTNSSGWRRRPASSLPSGSGCCARPASSARPGTVAGSRICRWRLICRRGSSAMRTSPAPSRPFSHRPAWTRAASTWS